MEQVRQAYASIAELYIGLSVQASRYTPAISPSSRDIWRADLARCSIWAVGLAISLNTFARWA
jgi:hypothetical protein